MAHAGDVALIYGLVAIVMTWPVARHLDSRLPGDLGDPLFVCWVLAWTAGQLTAAASGHFSALANYWDANIFSPEKLTLAYSEHFTAQALQIAPLYGATGNILLAYNVLFLSTFVLSALSVYLLVRALSGRPLAALLGGLAFAYAPYRLGQFPHLQILSSYWMPLALLGFRTYFARQSAGAQTAARAWPLAGGAAAVVMQNLSCAYYMLFFAPFCAAYCLYEIVHRRLVRQRAMWGSLLLAVAAIAILTWPFVRPYMQVRTTAGFGARAAREIVDFSADTYAFATASPNARLLGGWLRAKPSSEGEGFPGFTIVAFAALAVVAGARTAAARVPWSSLRGWRYGALAASLVTATACLLVVAWVFVAGTKHVQVAVPIGLGAAAFGVFLALGSQGRGDAPPGSDTALAFFACAALAAALLALGPEIHVHGRYFGPGPYALLLHYVPGFDGLRVPARFLMLVSLFLAVLAGLGAAWLLARARTPLAVAVVVAGLAGIVAEGWMAPIETNMSLAPAPTLTVAPRPTTGARMNPIYTTIRNLPGPVVLVEFPFGDTAYEVLAEYYAGYHRRPLINGYSGFFPQSYADRLAALSTAPQDPAAADVLRASGATHALVHESAFEGTRGSEISAWLLSLGARPAATEGRDKLFTLP